MPAKAPNTTPSEQPKQNHNKPSSPPPISSFIIQPRRRFMESSAETAPPIARDATLVSPCAGCKFLRRKCQPNCVFAPYFPANQPQKFVDVHRVFGASNVTKIIRDLPPCQREDAVRSLVYEAQTRIQDPVYGCVGVILVLEDQLQRLKFDLSRAWAELARLEMALPEWLQEEQQRMMMVMMVSGGADEAALVAAENGSSGSFGEQFGIAGAGEEEWNSRGVEDYFSMA